MAFSVYQPTTTTPGDGQIAVFKQIVLNDGGGYNATSGIFTAPEGGLYQFSAHFCNAGSKYVAYAIVHNDTEIAISTKDNTPSPAGCSSVNALIKLKVGDNVTVRGTYSGNQLVEDRYRRASFIGVLIHQ